MTAVLVSGGTGLVGQYIVEDLVAHGYRVKIASRQPPAPGLFAHEIEHVPLTLDPDANQADIFDDVYYFVHAAFSHIPGRYRGGEGDDPASFRRANLEATTSLFEAARDAGVSRCVFLSSRAVYDGLPDTAPLNESAELAPTSLYGEIKLLAEQVLSAMTKPGYSGTSLRITGVYGDLRPNKWDALIADYLAGKPVPSRAGSEVHGRDVAGAVRLMLESESAKVAGEVFNVSDIVTDNHDLLELVHLATGSKNPLPEPADKTSVRTMTTDKLRALGWVPGGWPLFKETITKLARD